jgi:hypothetical protein
MPKSPDNPKADRPKFRKKKTNPVNEADPSQTDNEKQKEIDRKIAGGHFGTDGEEPRRGRRHVDPNTDL